MPNHGVSHAKDSAYTVFISHSSKDTKLATELCQAIEAEGYRCWIAPRNIRVGRGYPEEIARGLDSSERLILLLSEESNESHEVAREVEIMARGRKVIYPVRLKDIQPSIKLSYHLSSAQWIDLFSLGLDATVKSLVDDIRADEEGGNPDWEQNTLAAGTRRKRGTKGVLIGGALFCVLAAASALTIGLLRSEEHAVVTPALETLNEDPLSGEGESSASDDGEPEPLTPEHEPEPGPLDGVEIEIFPPATETYALGSGEEIAVNVHGTESIPDDAMDEVVCEISLKKSGAREGEESRFEVFLVQPQITPAMLESVGEGMVRATFTLRLGEAEKSGSSTFELERMVLDEDDLYDRYETETAKGHFADAARTLHEIAVLRSYSTDSYWSDTVDRLIARVREGDHRSSAYEQLSIPVELIEPVANLARSGSKPAAMLVVESTSWFENFDAFKWTRGREDLLTEMLEIAANPPANPHAIARLGEYYRLQKDPDHYKTAMRLFDLGLELQNPHCTARVAHLFLQKNDPLDEPVEAIGNSACRRIFGDKWDNRMEVGLKLAQRAAEKGSVPGMYYYGVQLWITGETKDVETEGIRWLVKAAESGHPVAGQYLVDYVHNINSELITDAQWDRIGIRP